MDAIGRDVERWEGGESELERMFVQQLLPDGSFCTSKRFAVFPELA